MHRPDYQGNWAPQIPRNIIKLYSKPGDLIVDPMIGGGGTTLIECQLSGRRGLGLDIHQENVELSKAACHFSGAKNLLPVEIRQGDARHMKDIPNSSADLIATHPPYWNIVRYGESEHLGDISRINCIEEFCDEIEKIARECFRILKPGKYCAILIGDTRKHGHFIPLAFRVMQRFFKAGFILKEDIIKLQHNCASTPHWINRKRNFLLIMHEHLFIFRKPHNAETRSSENHFS